MVSKNLYLNIIFRVSALAAIALLFGWMIFQGISKLLIVIVISVFIGVIMELVHFLNKTNRKIAYFFDAIRNEDSTLHFPVYTRNKSLKELNISLNKVNELIKSIKIEQREQEQYFQTILEHISIGIISYNEKGYISLANTAAKKLLCYEQLTHIEQLRRVDKNFYVALKEISPGERKVVSFNPGLGQVQLSLKTSLFKTTHENLMLVAIQDIKTELEEKELDSWIKLIRVLTHEIMNTIAPITSVSEMLLGYYVNLKEDNPSQKIIDNTIRGLEVINERGKGLISFVDSYRKLTRLPQPIKKPIQVQKFCKKIITLISIEPVEGNVDFDIIIHPENMEVFADEEQISQVLINLIKNSREALAGEKNGKVIIVGRIDDYGSPRIEVIDNGPGISPEIANKIFIPFFTTKESGSGIGLSLSRQIMQLHGGSLKVKTTPEGETVFSMHFQKVSR